MPVKELIIIQKIEFLLMKKKTYLLFNRQTLLPTGTYCQSSGAVLADCKLLPNYSFYMRKKLLRQLWFPLYRKCLRHWTWDSETELFLTQSFQSYHLFHLEKRVAYEFWIKFRQFLKLQRGHVQKVDLVVNWSGKLFKEMCYGYIRLVFALKQNSLAYFYKMWTRTNKSGRTSWRKT